MGQEDKLWVRYSNRMRRELMLMGKLILILGGPLEPVEGGRLVVGGDALGSLTSLFTHVALLFELRSDGNLSKDRVSPL